MYTRVIKTLRSSAGKKCVILLNPKWVTPTGRIVTPWETQVFRETRSVNKNSLSELKQPFGLTTSEWLAFSSPF